MLLACLIRACNVIPRLFRSKLGCYLNVVGMSDVI
jgi:hypothetical protein